MRITVRIKPNARQAKLLKTVDGQYAAWVNAPPIEGRANEALIELLVGHFGVPRSRISIVRGHRGRSKIVDIS